MKIILTLLITLCLAVPSLSLAYYTPENFTLNGTHSPPASFSLDGTGGFFGLTADGNLFTQKPIVNSKNVRLHKFSINKAYFYISDRGTFLASSDLVALSIYYSLS